MKPRAMDTRSPPGLPPPKRFADGAADRRDHGENDEIRKGFAQLNAL
jgi:hypothetical protein